MLNRTGKKKGQPEGWPDLGRLLRYGKIPITREVGNPTGNRFLLAVELATLFLRGGRRVGSTGIHKIGKRLANERRHTLVVQGAG